MIGINAQHTDGKQRTKPDQQAVLSEHVGAKVGDDDAGDQDSQYGRYPEGDELTPPLRAMSYQPPIRTLAALEVSALCVVIASPRRSRMASPVLGRIQRLPKRRKRTSHHCPHLLTLQQRSAPAPCQDSIALDRCLTNPPALNAFGQPFEAKSKRLRN
jgi:hypothetical protein